MAKRNARKKSSDSRPLGLALLIGGTLLVSVSTAHNLLRLRSLRLDRATVQAYIAQAPKIETTSSYPAHIFIKWRVDIDIEPAVYDNGNWTISPDQASYLLSSARVGESGNIVIYGHNKRSILGNIRVLKGGEIITLTTREGKQYDYQVTQVKEVDPSDTALIQPTSEEVLTIYTCSGLLDSQRFVVRALPINESNQAASF